MTDRHHSASIDTSDDSFESLSGESANEALPQSIVRLQDADHPYASNPAFSSPQEVLRMGKELYADVQARVSRYNNGQSSTEGYDRYRSIIAIMEAERPHRERLEHLAVQMVMQQLDVPPGVVDFDVRLTHEIDFEEVRKCPGDAPIPGEISNADFDLEVQKRRTINALIAGASRKGQYMFHLADSELSAIHPDLVTAYGRSVAINEADYWQASEEDLNALGASPGFEIGISKLKFREDGTVRVIARGVIFPILLHELFKGVAEVVALHGLPEDRKLREAVTSRTDFLGAETWDLRVGYGLWDAFLKALPPHAHGYEMQIFQSLVALPAPQFHNVMRNIVSGNPDGRRTLELILNDVREDLRQEALDSF